MTAAIIDIPKIYDRRGSLSFVQNGSIPFDIRRVYWIYDMPAGGERYGRALLRSAELIIAVSGSFDVTLSDGHGHRRRYRLDRPWKALLIPPMTWREIGGTVTGSRALVLSSGLYDESEYIRERREFSAAIRDYAPADELITPPAEPRELPANKGLGNCSIDDAREITLERHPSHKGSLAVLPNAEPSPFDAQRVFYIYDVPTAAERGGHAHHKMQELIVALSGSFDVEVNDGKVGRRFTLNRPDCALHVPGGLWRSLSNFSSGAVCLAFASELYDPDDYIRSFQDYRFLNGSMSQPEQISYIQKKQWPTII